MNNTINGVLSAAARLMIAAIFILSAVGNKVPQFDSVAGYMASEGVPYPRVMLAGAIAFLIVGGLSVVVGYQARIGAALLLAFLVLATYFFHDFWTLDDPTARQQQMIQFLKNLSLMGTMLFLIANGPGRLSVDALVEPNRIDAAHNLPQPQPAQ